jgi:phosphoribosylformylglycinamidine synthase subunit PurL
VVGGNVSLYNEGVEGPIYPTPVVGMVGGLPDPGRAPGCGFVEEGHAIALVGPFEPSLQGSELEKLRGRLATGLSELDLARHADALIALRGAVRDGSVASAHDVSEGGLACALAECCIAGGVGARVDLSPLPGDPEAALFGEGPGGVVVAGAAEAIRTIDRAVVIGEVGGNSLELAGPAGSLEIEVDRAREVFERAIPDRLT